MSWSRYALKRLIVVVPMLLAVSLLLFGIMNVLPGGPEALYAGENLDPATIAYVRRNLGLDEPLPVQYVRWIAAAARGDLGRSFRDGQPVLDHIAARLPATLQLSVLALSLALAVAIPGRGPRGQPPPFVARSPDHPGEFPGPVLPELLARNHADPALLGRARLAAGIRHGHLRT